ncbi:MAG: hypothetical protein WBM31_19375, partial [Pseudolabrys sp.]
RSEAALNIGRHGSLLAALRSGLVVVYDISPKALGPTSELSAVLGRYALEKPGDCSQARLRN